MSVGTIQFGESYPERHEEHEEIRLLHDIAHTLHQIKRLLTPHIVVSFVVTQGGISAMPVQGPLKGIAPGLSDVFFAAPVDSSGNVVTLAAGVVPVWTSSDPTDAITPTADGLSATISVAPTATPGAFHTLTVALPDGSVSSPNPLPILTATPPPPPPVASFVVAQGAPPARK